MGINPMALARRKHPGSTGSYVHKLKQVINYMWEMDATLISLVIFDVENLHEDKNIKRIVVFTQCPWDESIVVRIHNR